MKNSLYSSILLGVGLFALFGCRSGGGSAEHIPVVSDFDATRYMGTWYEIARYPHSFEQGLERVQAAYSLLPSGRIRVVNSGVRPDGRKKEIQGTAYACSPPGSGWLRVSFFWPFYGDYRILFLEKDYSGAIVGSNTMDYLWILNRAKSITPEKRRQYLDFIQKNGFDSAKLQWITQ